MKARARPERAPASPIPPGDHDARSSSSLAQAIPHPIGRHLLETSPQRPLPHPTAPTIGTHNPLQNLRCAVGASEVSIALGVPISRGFLPWQPSNAAHRPWSVLRTWVSGTGIRNASQKLPRACTWKVRRTTLRQPGSGSAASDVRSGGSETGFSTCSRKRPPVRGEKALPPSCGSAWPQP